MGLGLPPIGGGPCAVGGGVGMPRIRSLYSPEFRVQIVKLVRAGHDPDDLARELEPTAQSIRASVAKAGDKTDRWEGMLPATAATGRDPTSMESLFPVHA